MSFETPNDQSDSPEHQAYDLRLSIIDRVQKAIETIKQLDEVYLEFQSRHKLPRIDRYLINSPTNDEVLAPHYRIMLAPEKRLEVLHGVVNVRLRIPIFQGQPTKGVTPEFLADDIFITNIMGEDRAARYLLTPRGMFAYAHPEEIIVDEDGEAFGNFFAVRNIEDSSIPQEPTAADQKVESSRQLLSELDLLKRQEELIRLYQPVVQDNRPTTDSF